jgi:hypothetical protein
MQTDSGLRCWCAEEPRLIFGDGQSHIDQKTGLTLFGPCMPTEPGGKAPVSIRIGIIGSGHTVDLARGWIERCKQGIMGSKEQPILRPGFPGFESIFGCEIMLLKQWEETIPQNDILGITQIDPFTRRVGKATRLFTDRLRNFSEREPRPNVVICALPQEIVDSCGSKRGGQRRVRLTRRELQLKKLIEYNRRIGQQTLFPLDEVELGLADFLPEASDLRRLLKAEAMEIGIATQLAKPSTFTGKEPSQRLVQDDATRAWNFCVALYYKGGGFPWRMLEARQGTCYIGISFYKEQGGRMRTSLAQVFTHTGEGLVLRGDRFAWDEKRGKSPHLSGDSAFKLLTEALNLYKRQMGQAPTRLVVHKSSRYWPDELAGFKKAASGLTKVDFVAFGMRGIRFLRKGTYPPLRGTVVELAKGDYLLYTRGYVPYYGTYPGLRIPQPLEILEHHGDSDADTICREVLGLTKMNWNNADLGIRERITLEFSREVGRILSHVEEEVNPRPQYFFYM